MNRIKILRKRLGLSRAETTRLLGMPYRTLQNWENGTTKATEWAENLVVEKLESMLEKTYTKEHTANKIKALLEEIENFIYEHSIELDGLIYDGYFDTDEKYKNFLKAYATEKGIEDYINDCCEDEIECHMRRIEWVEGAREPNFLPFSLQFDYIDYLQDMLSHLQDNVNEN